MANERLRIPSRYYIIAASAVTSRQTNEQRGHCGLWEKCIVDEGSYVHRQSISMVGYFTKGESYMYLNCRVTY